MRNVVPPRASAGAAVLLASSLLLAGCGQTSQVGASASTTTGASDAASATSSTTGAAGTSGVASASASGTAANGQGATCSYPVSGTAAKTVDPPATTGVANTGTTTATMHMSEGDITLTLNRQAAPCTVNSFVSLAKQGYFDATKCHRLTTQGIFVLQCGDPTGTGTGGPGYTFKDELTGKETYPKGTVAMANAGADTNGSQFFLVYEDTSLPASYTVFGTMDATSLGVLQKIAAQGTANGSGDGTPAADTTIKQVTLG